jgi:hypothetical protein
MASTSSGASASTSGLNLANFAGLNPNFLSSLHHLGADPKNPLLAAFDPKMFGALDPKTAALFGASLDPKNNPLAGLDPKNALSMFGGFPGLGSLGGLGSFGALGNMGNMGAMGNMGSMQHLFSNLAGFMPDMPTSSAPSASTTNTTTKSASASRREDKGKKPATSSSSASANANANAAAAAAASLPFLFPNPSMLYGHLGLGGLNPFSLPAGIPLSTAFSNLGAQGFMNGLTTTMANDPGSTSTKTTASASGGGGTSSDTHRGSSSRRERADRTERAERDRSDRNEGPSKERSSKSERSSHGLDLTPARTRGGGEPVERERRSRHVADDDSKGHKKSPNKLKLDE